jgi:hypothetical protein
MRRAAAELLPALWRANSPKPDYTSCFRRCAGKPNWFVQVTAATEAGLLRELVMMQGLQLELTLKNNELLDRLAVTSSLDFLTRMEGTDGKAMTDLYTRMVGAQQ